ncbi:hypothetical protein C6497_14170 [Candidatus Poribacteria bacterium]|nr:MAG: hypothetical protein C6497_14170 [Candidatus Poribacteria bacterium]
MDSLKKVIGVVLILIAVIIALHTILEPVYHTSDPESDNPYSSLWGYINPLSAISIILGILFSYSRKSRITDDSSIQEFITANTLFYGFMFCAIIFFWNWFGILKVGADFTAVSADTRSLVWIFFDALQPLLNGALGAHLLRSASND